MSEQEDTLFGEEDEQESKSEENQDGVLWGKEREELQANQWFTPPTGKSYVRFLDNGTKDTNEYDDETREVVNFQIEVVGVPDASDHEEGEELKWTVTKGVSKSGLFGQIAEIAGENGDDLTDVEIELVRKGTGTETSYTVLERDE